LRKLRELRELGKLRELGELGRQRSNSLFPIPNSQFPNNQ